MMKKSISFFLIFILISVTLFRLLPFPIANASSSSWLVIHDDDECLRYGSTFNKDYGQNYLGYSTLTMKSGYRFQNITIPKGAPIISAYLELNIVSEGVDFEVDVYGFDEDDITYFSTRENYDALTRTTAYVTWEEISPSATTFYNSSDIASVVQEIIDRDGWVSGNDIGFETVDTDKHTGTQRQYTYISGILWGARLHIVYGVLPHVTFYHQSNSVFMVNGTKIANGTETAYVNLTVLELQGIINVSTQFIEWDITNGDIQVNPYNYTITTNATIWLMTDGVEGGNGDGETLFLFGSVNVIPINLLFYIVLTTIGLTLLLKTQFLGKILSTLLFAFQAIWISGDVLFDTQINYISAYNETTGIYRYANTVTHIGTPILSFLIILSIGLALISAIDVFRTREKRKG